MPRRAYLSTFYALSYSTLARVAITSASCCSPFSSSWTLVLARHEGNPPLPVLLLRGQRERRLRLVPFLLV